MEPPDVIDDATWSEIRPILERPRSRRPGRPIANLRMILEGLIYKRRTGCSWERLPTRYGARGTLWEWSKRWAEAGILDEIAERIGPGLLVDQSRTKAGRPKSN